MVTLSMRLGQSRVNRNTAASEPDSKYGALPPVVVALAISVKEDLIMSPRAA